MSINSVLRAMHGLQAALPDAEIKGAHAHSDDTTLRQRQLELLGYLPQLFRECPELEQISIEGVTDEDRGSDGEMYKTCFAAPTFSFVFEVDGQEYRLETTAMDGSEIDAEMDEIADELCDGDADSELGRALENRRISMVDITRRYENRVRANFENDPTFWDARRQIYLSRVTFEKCHVGELLDLDALRCHMQLPARSLTSRLPVSDAAPPYWNAVNLTAVKERLAGGMDPQACDDNNVLPLVAAAAYGQREAIEALLHAGVDINAVDGNGFTAFTAAVAAGRAEILPMLVERGANPDGAAVVPSFLVAIGRNDGGAMVRAVLAAGADFEAKTPSGKTFASSFESYLDRANKLTRDEVAGVVNSIKTQNEVLDALDGTGPLGRPQRAKSSGMSL